MASPFPGMDPYLEHPSDWMGVHNTLVSFLCEAISAELPDRYEARIRGRRYILGSQGDLLQGVNVYPVYQSRRPESFGLMEADVPLLFCAEPVEIHEAYIHIFKSDERSRIVTAIELLSPANKGANTTGRRIYLESQQEILRSPTHLLEIDLLRMGEHTVCVPSEAVSQQGRWTYLVCLSRVLKHTIDTKREVAVWPRTLQDRLPRVIIPLAPGDPDLVLDIQAALVNYYDSELCQSRIDYSLEPYPPLKQEDREWSDTMLREKGFRTGNLSAVVNSIHLR